MKMIKMDKKIVRFLWFSFISVTIVCVIVFISLSIFMSNNTEKSVKQVSEIYMSEVSVQIRQKFDSIISLRMEQAEGVVSRTPPDEAVYGEEMLDELRFSAEIRKFSYLGLYGGDGYIETVYGKPVSLPDPDYFETCLREENMVIERGIDSEDAGILLLGTPAAYPMENGQRSMALVTGIPMEYLDQALFLDVEEGNVYSHIIDKDGNFVIRSSDAFRDNYFDRIRERFDSLEGRSTEKCAKELQEAMKRNENYSTHVFVDGEERHLYCSPLSDNCKWYLIAAMPNEVLNNPLAQLDHMRIKATIGCVCVIMLTVLVIFIRYSKMLQEQMQALHVVSQEAVRANKAKSEFLSSMSHDIRTPMNAIIGMTDIALRNIGDADRVEGCLKKVMLSSKHLLGLINDVLDMSKIESGKMTLNIGPTSLREMADDLVNIMQPQIKERNLYFDIFIRDIKTENVCCDSVRLNQILLNLLSNAVKFTPEGGRVDVRIYQEPSPLGEAYVRTHFIVEDTGIGMSEEFQKKIFDTFTREESEQVQHIMGTGLGMAITKNIVNLMHGTIVLESELGKGSRFDVALDLQIGESSEEMKLPAWNVLVVDDNEALCTSAAANLEEMGVHAEWATEGSAAIQMIEERHKKNEDYRFALIDWKMPHMGGLQTVREIRERVGNRVPVFLISSYNWGDIEDKVSMEEIEGFIAKPLFKSTLYACLEKYMEKPKTKTEQTQSQNVDFSGKRLLIAEDIEINWIIVEENLGAFGIELAHAENGKECVEMFEQSAVGFYDGILMDIRMPVMDGYDATRAIRALTRQDKDIPIIAMTADAFSDDVKVCLECGMNAHVAKPLDMRELIRTLQKFLGS